MFVLQKVYDCSKAMFRCSPEAQRERVGDFLLSSGLLCFCYSLLGKHVTKVYGKDFFFFFVRSLSRCMFSKLAGVWQGTQLVPNPPAHPLSKWLVKVINFTVIDLNVSQEEEKLRKPMPL